MSNRRLHFIRMRGSTIETLIAATGSGASEDAKNCSADMRIVAGTMRRSMNWLALRAG
jgi:hypothetical protein